jgi:membrane-bound lytic murein transglycosylase F
MAIRFIKYICFVIVVFLFACSPEHSTKKRVKKARSIYNGSGGNLDTIKNKGALNVITSYSSTSYFLYRGQPMGYEYDLLKRFAEHLGVELNIQVSNNIDTMFYALISGQVDLIAHGLTITRSRKKQVNFSDYLYLTHQVLVQKKPDNWRSMTWSKVQSALIHDAIELIGDTISVRANSSYITRLENLSEEIGGKIYIDTLSGDLSTDRIIEMVAKGEIKYTVADNNIASINASNYPVLDIRVPISFSQRLAWAVRPNSPELEEALNEWIGEMKKGVAYYVIYNKYFKNQRDFKQRDNSEFYSLNDNKISEYDDIIRTNAKELGWDWRLLAAMIYQESKFNPESESWAGAKGLMQMMPKAAERFGVLNRSHPEQNLNGGTQMLKLLWSRFDEIPDSVQRIKLTIASYNCGYSHVVDAQNLAKEEGVDSTVWDGNVEEMILKLSYPEHYNKSIIKYGYVRGIETATYIKEIFNRYEHYLQFVE